MDFTLLYMCQCSIHETLGRVALLSKTDEPIEHYAGLVCRDGEAMIKTALLSNMLNMSPEMYAQMLMTYLKIKELDSSNGIIVFQDKKECRRAVGYLRRIMVQVILDKLGHDDRNLDQEYLAVKRWNEKRVAIEEIKQLEEKEKNSFLGKLKSKLYKK